MEDCEDKAKGRTFKSNSSRKNNGESRKKRRTPNCTFCKNHTIKAAKKGHLCPFKDCDCPLCTLLRKAQISMRHQQRVWRHQKNKQQISSSKFQDLTNVIDEDEKIQVCSKCRNHHIIAPKKHHKCPFSKCSCQYCSLTFKRRELMKYLQRVRRSNVTSPVTKLPLDEEGSVDYDTECNSTDSGELSGENDCNDEQGSHDDSDFVELNGDITCTDTDFPADEGETRNFIEQGQFFPPPLMDIPVINSPPPLIPITSNYPRHSSTIHLQNKCYNESFTKSDCEMLSQSQSLYPLYEEKRDPSPYGMFHTLPSARQELQMNDQLSSGDCTMESTDRSNFKSLIRKGHPYYSNYSHPSSTRNFTKQENVFYTQEELNARPIEDFRSREKFMFRDRENVNGRSNNFFHSSTPETYLEQQSSKSAPSIAAASQLMLQQYHQVEDTIPCKDLLNNNYKYLVLQSQL